MTVVLQGKLIALHGVPKVGKTQTCDSFPSPVQFIATEFGHKFIKESHKEKVIYLPSGAQGWEKFRKMLSAGVLKKRKPKTVVIDTTNKLYERCLAWTCAKLGIEYPDLNDMGKSWKKVKNEFMSGLERLAEHCDALDSTLIFVEHTETLEVKLMVETFNRMQAAMSKQARECVLPAANHIWFLGYENQESVLDRDRDGRHDRWLWCSGTEGIEAGTQDTEVEVRVVKRLPKTGQYDYILKVLNRKAKKKDGVQASEVE